MTTEVKIKKHNSTLELDYDRKMINDMKKHEQNILAQERIEEQNRRHTIRYNLDQQKDGDLSIDIGSDYLYGKEFELNKSLIKEVSPHRLALV